MENKSLNPYLPSWEYVPDAEPHIFGDRVYIYGSHDAFGAPVFCVNDYVCWSAPKNDLSDWRYEGVIYKKTQDPSNRLGIRSLYAPDVTKGPDGRFYLYYCYDFLGEMGVAVCDTPSGKYEYYGKVHYKDGKAFGRKKGDQFPFDPAVLLDDDGRIWLYSGFAKKVSPLLSRGHSLANDGGVVIELDKDMLTMKSEPKVIFPISGKDAFPHPFFEASSIRKVDGKYCFVYSSSCNHELCYAFSDRPDGGFSYGGVLVDIGDLSLNGNTDENHANNYLGNTHGGLIEIDGEWYIFYHRQTNRTSFARQACAERLERTPDGGFKQAEITSCGLGGPLKAKGEYGAYIACNLWAGDHKTGRVDKTFSRFALRKHPYFTQSGRDRKDNPDQYIANMQNKATAGFKYFDFEDVKEIEVTVSGAGYGNFVVSTDPQKESVCVISVDVDSKKKCSFRSSVRIKEGIHPLYFTYHGTGSVNFHSFSFIVKDKYQ